MAEPVKSISGSSRRPPTTLAWSEALGKRVRTGDWADQAVSTTRKIIEAIDAQQYEPAAQLIDYWMEEAKVVYVIYDVWTRGFIKWLTERGLGKAEVDAELRRLRTMMAFPDGEPYDAAPRWRALGEEAGALANTLRVFELSGATAVEHLDSLREHWRQLHDRGADMMWGLLTVVADRFGEAAIEDCFRSVLDPYLEERYKPFDIRERPYAETLDRNLYLTFEAMRGHLCGPDRSGDVDVEERDDRWVVSFDPCGSGGRGQRGDPVEGTGPRPEPPYEFGVTTEPHDWAWNETGICYYCAHCCFALERWPAEQWGHPLRVVDSPRYPDETTGDKPSKCRWTIFKSIEMIPPEAYQRIGMRKPSSAG